jgi:hypothetical protein
VPQDYVLAHVWYTEALSKEAGSDPAAVLIQKRARQRRDAVAFRMTPEQIAEAGKLAAEMAPAASQ